MKIKILFLSDKLRLISLMAKDYAITKIHKKLFMDNSKTGSLKEWDNYILQAEIIISASLNLIKKMEEVCISGQENNQIYMKGNL